MLTGYLLSLLTRQRVLLRDRFVARYPHAWLVWEPGGRQRPKSAEQLHAGATRLPGQAELTADDAVCFPLPEPTKEAKCLTLGRNLDCSVNIDDMSVSREHARLWVRAGRWQLEPTSAAQTVVSGVAVKQGQWAALENGCRITMGGVQLTFYERDRFVDRLLAEEQRPA